MRASIGNFCVSRSWLLFGLVACVLVGSAFSSRWSRLVADDDSEPAPTQVTVKPQSEFSITVSTNPSTGYNVGLGYLSEGIFLLRTESAKPAANAPPGSPSGLTFHFYQWHATQPEKPLEIVFGRFQPFDPQETYREEKYVVEITGKSLPSVERSRHKRDSKTKK